MKPEVEEALKRLALHKTVALEQSPYFFADSHYTPGLINHQKVKDDESLLAEAFIEANSPASKYEILIEKIKTLTDIDINNKSKEEILACPVEELGELARELKIEGKTHGNTYKVPGEGSRGEAVDLWIGALCMYFINRYQTHGKNDKLAVKYATNILTFRKCSQFSKNKCVWKSLKEATKHLGTIFNSSESCLCLATNAIEIFLIKTNELNACYTNNLGDLQEEEFIKTAYKKLEKWEKSIK